MSNQTASPLRKQAQSRIGDITDANVCEKRVTSCVVPQDARPNSGYVGKSKPPYNESNRKALGVRIGGPHMIRLPDGRFVAVVRPYDSPVPVRSSGTGSVR